MRILPDSVRCHLSRCATGNVAVIPDVLHRFTPKSLNPKSRLLVLAGALVGLAVIIFSAPPVLILLVPAWCWWAWRLGYCPHCEDLADLEEEEYESV